MRKALIIAIATSIAVGSLFPLTFLGCVSLGEPKLRVEFYPLPPWRVRLGDSLEVSIGIANDAWLLARAKDIHAIALMPEDFISSRTGTNECEMYFGTLYGGDGLGNTLVLSVSSNVSPGNYTVTIKVLGENFSEKVFTSQIEVLPT